MTFSMSYQVRRIWRQESSRLSKCIWSVLQYKIFVLLENLDLSQFHKERKQENKITTWHVRTENLCVTDLDFFYDTPRDFHAKGFN